MLEVGGYTTQKELKVTSSLAEAVCVLEMRSWIVGRKERKKVGSYPILLSSRLLIREISGEAAQVSSSSI
ncbi:predicted protein [Histoplasma mississippiense (nom. inval.)]|uniref:predicted protein n=1 Tax=Ajellomyces capsulatus (strain NAm1 / WU24) TaxID=2059318 RepID=UPI000157CA8A|nr:predicted protein [Histoplasma mississippiense (nom. inval.)]EDN09759.1 predicted protein [Histoplasma mississippiense (nom. inval.)]